MGFGWLKKIGGIGRKIIDVGALFEPHLAMLDSIIDGVENSMKGKSGADKKAAVIEASDAVLKSSLLKLKPEEIAAIQGARSAAIDAIVAAKNAEEKAMIAVNAFRDAVAAIKAD